MQPQQSRRLSLTCEYKSAFVALLLQQPSQAGGWEGNVASSTSDYHCKATYVVSRDSNPILSGHHGEAKGPLLRLLDEELRSLLRVICPYPENIAGIDFVVVVSRSSTPILSYRNPTCRAAL